MATGDDLRSQLFALPAPERADLARQLLLSLEDDHFDDDVQRTWAEEVKQRSQAYEDGDTPARDWRESLVEIRESLEQGRRA